MLDENIVGSQALMYKYGLNTDGCSEGALFINIEYKIYAPEIDITTYETYYNGLIDIENVSTQSYFTNIDIYFCFSNYSHEISKQVNSNIKYTVIKFSCEYSFKLICLFIT